MGLEDHQVLRKTPYYAEAVERIRSGQGEEVKKAVDQGQGALTDETRLERLQRDARSGLSRLVLSYELALRDHAPHLYEQQ